MVDKLELKKTWDLFVGNDGFTEVRILGKFTYSGYFRSFENLCSQLEPYTNMDDEQIYFVMNKIASDCYARSQCEKFVKNPKSTTKDDEITDRQFLLCDFDPIRRPNISSSDEQFEMARLKAQEVYEFLKSNGFTDQVVAISGSGWHLLIPVCIKCDEESDDIIKRFYTYMGSRFSDDKVEFDEKVFNRSRITKLYSVVSKKGANIPSNPWRQSKIVYIPNELKPTSLDTIKRLADLVPKEEPKQVSDRGYHAGYGNQPFDLVAWLNQHGIAYKEDRHGASTRYTLEYCPWVDTHSDRKKWDSALFQDPDGKITFNCQHSHCRDKKWSDFRVFYEPDAYAPKPQQYHQRIYHQTVPQLVHQPVILPETQERGKKWLSMKDIQKVNLDEMQGFVTGITRLDLAIRKLYYGEVTILSGSNASGKSSLLNTIILNAVQQGVPNALYSGELPPRRLKAWIQIAAAGKDYLRRSRYGDSWYVPDMIAERIDEWLDGRFFIFNDDEYSHRWEQILSDMEELAKAGIKLFTLDNLMSLSIDIFDGDNNKKQKELINQIVKFAKDAQVHIILVAHPRKATGFIRKTDIAGTSDLTNAVDNVFIVHRVNNDFKKLGGDFYGQANISAYLDYSGVIECCKNRQWGIMDTLFGTYYEIESRRFKNTPEENIRYGWINDGIQTNMYETQNNDMPFGGPLGQDDMPF